MHARRGLFWLEAAGPAIAADVHHRHRLNWWALPTDQALLFAELMLATPGTYTHSTTLTAETAGATLRPAPMPKKGAQDLEPEKARTRSAGANAIAAAEGEYVAPATAPMTDAWAELARRNDLKVSCG